jgi:DHA2 family multidrug resistance protein-like MFS transporter
VDEPVGVAAPSKRAWTLVATSTVTVLSMMDQTIANTALPTIAHDINASAAASIWVINGYQLALTIGIVPLATAGDILGYWRVYRIGLLIFGLASLGCVLSHSLLMLTAARFVQGLAGAALTVTSAPINRLVYPPKMLGRATGISAMAVSLGAATGPIVGGAILAIGPWQWLFALNIPIAIAMYVLAIAVIPKTPGHRGAFDTLSAVMSVAMFGLAVIGFDSFGHHGSLPLAFTEIVAAAIVGWIFIRRQLATPLPMFAVDLFAQLRFTLAVFACYASFISQTIAWVALPFALQTVMGYKPLEIGALLLPWLLASAAVAPFSGRLADRYNSSRLAVIGLGTFSVGLLCTALMGPSPTPFDIAWRMAVCGIGYGLFQSPNNRSMQGSAPRERSGAPQAIQGVARVFGQTTGAVTVASIFAMEGHPTANGSGITDSAVVVAMSVATACAVLATLASLWRGVAVGSIVLAKAS